MKASVFVKLKSGVLDPQGKAIQHSAASLGYDGIEDIRQGKYFEIELDDSLSEADAETVVARLAAEILSNPVIEDFCVEMGR